jgi:hypothetical protein
MIRIGADIETDWANWLGPSSRLTRASRCTSSGARVAMNSSFGHGPPGLKLLAVPERAGLAASDEIC